MTYRAESRASAESAATLPDMTSNSIAPPPVPALTEFELAAVAAPTLIPDLRSPIVDEPIPDPSVWFLAGCNRCGKDLSQPFLDEATRDGWALDHAGKYPGHLVHLSVEVSRLDEAAPAAHRAVLLRFFRFGGNVWRWLCPSEGCARHPNGTPKWNGPYDTGQLALASWRAHRPQGLIVPRMNGGQPA